MVLVPELLYNVFKTFSNGDSDCGSSCTIYNVDTQHYTVLYAMVMYTLLYTLSCKHLKRTLSEHYPTDQLMSIFNDICNIRSYKE